MINIKESQITEFKQIWKDEYLKTICAFANSDGLNIVETLEYPYEAIREAVINALIHRDYTDTTVLQIRVYDEKIVFSNGATLSSEVPIEKFSQNHISKPFNPLIANMFYKAGFVESWGKGTNNMITDCIKMGMPSPCYEYTFGAVKVTFYKTTQETTQETKKVSTKQKILEELATNSSLTREDLSRIIAVSPEAIKQHIAILKKDGKLRRIGSTKSGYWEVVK